MDLSKKTYQCSDCPSQKISDKQFGIDSAKAFSVNGGRTLQHIIPEILTLPFKFLSSKALPKNLLSSKTPLNKRNTLIALWEANTSQGRMWGSFCQNGNKSSLTQKIPQTGLWRSFLQTIGFACPKPPHSIIGDMSH